MRFNEEVFIAHLINNTGKVFPNSFIFPIFHIMKLLIIFLIFLLLPTLSHSQSSPTPTSFDFLTGTWKTEHKWGDMTEIWSTVEGENLMCTFRCINDNKVIFYEWIIIESSPSGPVMKLRHFNPGSIAWEDKEHPHTYHLVSSTANQCVFESADKSTRISYERVSPTNLVSYLEKKDENGKKVKETFDYTLQ